MERQSRLLKKRKRKKEKTKKSKMDKQFTYSIQPLLTEKDGRLRGPMSPMLFAEEMAKAAGFTFNRLARLWFADECTHQCREDGGLTGYDTLLIGTVYKNDVWLSLWVDKGVDGTAVAMAYRSDGEIVFTEVYRNCRFAAKLNLAQVREIFHSVFADPKLIDLKHE